MGVPSTKWLVIDGVNQGQPMGWPHRQTLSRPKFRYEHPAWPSAL